MQVLVYEPKFVGHFLGFAVQAANAFARLNVPVVLAVPQKAEGSPQAGVKLTRLHPAVEVRYAFDVPVLYDKWTNARFETTALEQLLEMSDFDHVVIPSGDFVLAGLLRSRRLRRRLKGLQADIVLHNVLQVYSEIGKRARLHALWDQLSVSLARGIALYSVDPYATASVARWPAGLLRNPLRELPHFYERWRDRPERTQARQILGLPLEGRILGSIGDLGGRKGTELVIESFAAAEPSEQGVLALFGILSQSAKSTLARHAKLVQEGRILVRDEFVTDEDFQHFLAAMDAVWAGFPFQIGIASTLLHAAEAQRPVIASRYGCVGWMTEQYGLGRTFPTDVESMSQAIRWFQNEHDWRIDAAGASRLLAFHTTENFAKHLTAAFCRRNNLKPLDVVDARAEAEETSLR